MSSALVHFNELKPDTIGTTKIICIITKVSSTHKTKGLSFIKFDLIDETCKHVVEFLLFDASSILKTLENINCPSILSVENVKVCYHGPTVQLVKGPSFQMALFLPEGLTYDATLTYPDNTRKVLGDTEKAKVKCLRNYLISDECKERLEAIFPDGLVSFDPLTEARKLENLISLGTSATDAENIPPDVERSVAINNLITSKEKHFNKFSDKEVNLSNIKENYYFDIVVMVVGFLELSSKNSYGIRCTDGSLVTQELVKTESVYVSARCSQIVMAQINEFVVDVSVFDEHVTTARTLNVGDFVRIKNVHCYTPFGYSTPELILHGGNKFGRGIYRLDSDHPDVKAAKERLSRLMVTERFDLAKVLERFPPDEPRSLQTSPTSVVDSDLPFTALKDVINESVFLDTPKLFKIRAFVDWYEPDNYPAMIAKKCKTCGWTNESLARFCRGCNGINFIDTISLKLLIRDDSTRHSPVLCSVEECQAFEFFQISSKDDINLQVLEKIENVSGKWCNLMVCRVVMDEFSSPQMFLCHTQVKA